ncbi:glycosyl hydrolase family 28-related protein [Streptomyces sp. cg35]|uniref:right-handed parallel beta-helix repeat-containing protein n=1 Tax=Streptomyces sp. cg35 TaxID=3421650 RepID=UPI003D17D5AB
MTVSNAGTYGIGWTIKQVTIREIDGARNLARCIDTEGQYLDATTSVHRTGIRPQVGQIWLADRDLGAWTLKALIETDVASVYAKSSPNRSPQWLNALDFGAVGKNDDTDNYGPLQRAIDATPEGGTLYIPPGKYRIKKTLEIRRRNITIRGDHTGRWTYNTLDPTCIKPSYGGFTGSELIRIKDPQEGGHATNIDGVRIIGLTFNGVYSDSLTAPNISGLYATGAVRDLRIENCSFWQLTGYGIRTGPYTRTDGTFVFPKGWRLVEVTADANNLTGFYLQNLTDASLTDCLAVGNKGDGFYHRSPGDVIYTTCRAAWNTGHGYRLDFGSADLLYSGCTTDRNGGNGWYITCLNSARNRPTVLSGCIARRDGKNGGGAGVRVEGTTSNIHPPLIASGLTVVTGRDDDGTGVVTPAYGLIANKIRAVSLSGGYLEGTTAPLLTDDTSTIKADPAVLQYTAT